jgi:hypothetical protein
MTSSKTFLQLFNDNNEDDIQENEDSFDVNDLEYCILSKSLQHQQEINKQRKYRKWQYNYFVYLKDMYEQFKNDFHKFILKDLNNHILFDEFCYFIYLNSSQIISKHLDKPRSNYYKEFINGIGTN